MWDCARCGERIEDSFDTCWNCGTSREGTKDDDFKKEPNDPTVPNPGPESTEPAETDVDFAAIQSEGLNRRELATLICKTIGLVLFAVASVSAVSSVVLFLLVVVTDPLSVDFLEWYILAGIVPPIAMATVAFLLWKKADWIAKRMVNDNPRPIIIRGFSVQDAMVVAFSVVGLFFLFGGIDSLFTVVYVATENGSSLQDFWLDSHTWSAIIQLALSAWLIFGSRGIVSLIHRIRTAGQRDDVFDSEPERA